MTFNSYIFVFALFPLSFIGYFSLNHYSTVRAANIFLIGMSSVFFCYNSWKSLVTVWASIVVNYCLIVLIKKGNRKQLLFLGIVLNVVSLLNLKYWNFFMDNINGLFSASISFRTIFVPLGVSYFTFQQIAFLIDNYRDEVPEYNFDEYCLFTLFFPKALAGPILLHTDFFPQLRDVAKRKIDYDNIAKGLYAFSMGMAKKVIIADRFGELVDAAYANLADMNTTSMIIAALGYTLQLYFDFSGYCDMGIGISRLFNIELPVNFNSPYKAYSISEFWDRWHITLTRFFTKYVYIPLGGNRKGKARTYINIMIVFLISGLWHGAAWTFIVWGGLHGIMSVINRLFKKQIDEWNKVFSWLITFWCVNMAWIFFRAGNIYDAKAVIYKLLKLDFGHISPLLVNVFSTDEINIILDIIHVDNQVVEWVHIFSLLIFFAIAFFIILNVRNVNQQIEKFRPTIVKCIFSVIVLVWSILSFSSVTTFLYSGF